MKKKKISIILLGITLVFFILAWKIIWRSYDLQDGYKLQGYAGHHGMVFNGYTVPVITEEVMGIQGCIKGFLYGWVVEKERSNKIKYFVLNTKNQNIVWLNDKEYFIHAKENNCPHPDMDSEINLAGFANNEKFISR